MLRQSVCKKRVEELEFEIRNCEDELRKSFLKSLYKAYSKELEKAKERTEPQMGYSYQREGSYLL